VGVVSEEPKMTLTLAEFAKQMEPMVRNMIGSEKYDAAVAEMEAEANLRTDMKTRLDALEEFLRAAERYDHLVTVAAARILYATP
jgi:hypothetical protein